MERILEQIKNFFAKIKEVWQNFTPKVRRVIKISSLAAVVLVVVIVAVLTINNLSYKQIYPGMSDAEAQEVMQILSDMNVEAKYENGKVMVPAKQWDELQFQLSAKGYPNSTLNYDIFSSNVGITATEYQQKEAKIQQLEVNIAKTLIRWTGIDNAAIVISIPDSQNTVWNQGQDEATASATITPKAGYELSPQQVTAIKNHVAASVPTLKADKVTVTDTRTGTEPVGSDDSSSVVSSNRVEFEKSLERALQNNVKELLTKTYGYDGVVPVAKVVVDYDKMITEMREIIPPEEGSAGVIDYIEEYYVRGDAAVTGGVAGEENNTDVPYYPNYEGADDGDMQTIERITDFAVGYILKTIETNEPVLKSATLAVMVNDSALSTDKKLELIELISKSVNIEPENIAVSNFNMNDPNQNNNQNNGDGTLWGLPLEFLLIAGGAILFLLLVIFLIVVISLRRSKKKKRLRAEEAAAAEEEERRRMKDQEIADHKRSIIEEAEAGSNAKEDAITQEVREFAEHNPEVTANLIRSLMKEDR